MRALVVGTAGHVDHGKTALVRALTGVETDRWEQEQERGLTIDLGFAPLDLGEGLDAAVIDVPGHEDFVTNMLAGATGLDLLLLVVAADEGPMPQTREHLAIASLLGVEEGIVALSKVDRVEREEWLELAAEAVRDELRLVLGHDRWPVLPVSATEGIGVEDLRAALRGRADELVPRDEDDLFRLPVDRAFTVRGTGTVVTGTVWSGSVTVGERLRVLPGPGEVRVRGLQEHGTDRDRVGAGRRCALALAGPDPEEVPRGTTLATGDGWQAVDRIGALLRLPPYAPRGVSHGQRVRVYLGTREVMARVDLAGEDLRPGESGPARLRLEGPLVGRGGDRFVIRFYSPVVTIGGGRVAELSPGGDWPDRVEAWKALVDGEGLQRLAAAVHLSGGAGLATEAAPVVAGVGPPVVRAALEAPPPDTLFAGGRWFPASAADSLAGEVLEWVGGHHRRKPRDRSASREALRSTMMEAGYDEALVEVVLARLAEDGEVALEGPGVKFPGHEPELTEEERALQERTIELIRDAGLEPPTAAELGERLEMDARLLHDLLDLAVAADRLVAVSSEIYLPPERARELLRAADEVLDRQEPAEASHFKDALGVTRKYLIPYLQYLDARGLTRRTEIGRVRAGGSGGT